jgi:hypothetical protein
MHSKKAQYDTGQTRRGEGKRKGLIGAGEVGCGLVKTPCSESLVRLIYMQEPRQRRLLLTAKVVMGTDMGQV